MGAERIVAGLAMTLLGCASIAGVGSDETELPPAAEPVAGRTAPPTAEPSTSASTPPAPTTTEPDGGAPTSTTNANGKTANGGTCTEDKQCASDNCDDDGTCKKKKTEQAFCSQTGGLCYEDDLCCPGNYCKFTEGRCTACKGVGEVPELRGAVTCCSGKLGSGGKCS